MRRDSTPTGGPELAELFRAALAGHEMSIPDLLRGLGIPERKISRRTQELRALVAGEDAPRHVVEDLAKLLELPHEGYDEALRVIDERAKQLALAEEAQANEPITPTHAYLVPVPGATLSVAVPDGLDRDGALEWFRSGALPNLRRVLPLWRGYGIAIYAGGREERVRFKNLDSRGLETA